jgi:hypothetical protein
MQLFIRLCGVALLAACASRQGSTVGTPLVTPTSVSYLCPPTVNLRVRISATSATIMVDNDGPYTLPQVTSRTDYSVYSDGQHVLQISRDNASYGIGRRLRECSRN